MKLGSLFDGSGTAPLAAVMCGIEPVWASEIEPYPVKVTTARFPGMKHLGDITRINGAEIEPVDIISGGSPCQDLSVAGKQKGLHDGERSHLFFEMTRIIKEMREVTNGKYPRYIIWENVPGAFSSNNGADFLAVLQAFAEIADPDVHVPRPPCRRKTDRLAWQYAGSIVGDGYSIAWRTVDAQYWGVPQRRRRIYFVADLGSECAGEILFERKGMSGDSEPGRDARKETAADDGRSTEGGSGVKCLNPLDSQTIRQYDADGVYPALTSNATGGQNRQGICVSAGFVGRQGAKSGSVASVDCRNMVLNDELSGTLQAKENGGYSLNYQNPVVYEPRSMLAENWARSDAKNALRAGESKSAHAVVYSSGSFGTLSEGVGCLGTGTRATAEMVAVYPGVGITSKQDQSNPRPGDAAPTLSTDTRNYLVKQTVYPAVTGPIMANSHPGSYTGQDAFNDMLPVVPSDKPPRRYIVRRLTPLECCRLQGFPDWWEDGVEGSDSARCKMWGNGMALPNMLHVMKGILKEDVNEPYQL